MTRQLIGTVGLICCLTLTVLTGGGWAEEKTDAKWVDQPPISTTNDIVIKLDREKFDKLVFNEIGYYKNICFKLKGDDVERCVETEWLYKWLKMMQP